MAVIKTAPVVSSIRGSVGGVTFTRSRAGAVARARIKPCGSFTAPQMKQRAMHTQKIYAWRNRLSDANRLEWNTAAGTVRWINKIGEEYTPSGYQLFMRQAQDRHDHPFPAPLVPVYPLKCPQCPLILTWNEANDRIYIDTPTNLILPVDGWFLVWYSGPYLETHYHAPTSWTFKGIWIFLEGLPFQQWFTSYYYKTRPSRFFVKIRTTIGRWTMSDPQIFGFSVPPEP